MPENSSSKVAIKERCWNGTFIRVNKLFVRAKGTKGKQVERQQP